MGIDRVESYNPVDMTLLSSDITDLDFGSIIRGKHCFQTFVIKPVLSGTITRLCLFLEDNGGLTNAQFGYLASLFPYSDIQPGDPELSDHFIEDPGVSDFSTSDDGVSLNSEHPEYIWLDAQIGLGSDIGTGTLNYRFVFEYSD